MTRGFSLLNDKEKISKAHIKYKSVSVDQEISLSVVHNWILN